MLEPILPETKLCGEGEMGIVSQKLIFLVGVCLFELLIPFKMCCNTCKHMIVYVMQK